MAAPSRSPLMSDVARRAGVSAMTVSRVINNHPNVTDATRIKVRAAIDELGYRANPAARRLAGGRSHVLGAISVQPESWGPSRTVFGIEAAAQASDHLVSFKTVLEPSSDAIRSAVSGLCSVQAEGIIVVARLRSAVEALQDLVLPIPTLVTYPTSLVPLAVGIDQKQGARLATRHLLELGHESVVHVRGPDGWIDADERVEGWRAELDESGADGLLIGGDWTPASGYAAGRRIAADPSLTAVFAANDEMAVGLLLALHEAGRRVPQDVSVVGFDDVPEAGYLIPPLTTVRQDFAALGKASVERILSAIEGEQPTADTLEPELILRSSTSGPASRSR